VLGQKAAELARPVNVEKVNTGADETDPYPLATGLGLLYVSNKSGHFELFQTTRAAATQAWPAGKLLFGMPDADVRTPAFYKDFLYYATDVVPDEKFAKLKNFDLYRRVEEQAPIPLIGISEKDDEQRPWITANGNEFYFSRKLADGWTLMVASGPSGGPIGKATPVGFAPGFSHATLNATVLVMYMQGPLDDGRLGLFRSSRPKVGAAWTKPEPLRRLNHPDAKRGDQAPALSADGTRLYFASDRPGGKGGLDVWTILVSAIR
jgi:hypothetical protein